MLDNLFDIMSDLTPFVAGLLVGLSVVVFKKTRPKNLGKDVELAGKVLKAVVKGKGEHKMVFVVRNDLGMTKGKIASQCAHAALECYKSAMEQAPENVRLWSHTGQPKIVVKLDGDGAKDILKLEEHANELGVINALIRDAGRTQIERGTATVLALGPSPAHLVDKVSGHLKLM